MNAILISALLLGCTASAPPTAQEIEAAWPLSPPSALAAAPFDLAHQDIVSATGALQAVHDGLVALPPANRELARAAAARAISVPATSDAAWIPLVMQQTLARHADPALEPLKRAVDLHVATLDQLGVADLPLPPEASTADVHDATADEAAFMVEEPLRRATQDQWPFDNAMRGLTVEIERLLDSVRDPALRQDLLGLDSLLRSFGSTRC